MAAGLKGDVKIGASGVDAGGPAAFEGFAVVLGVEEEFRLADDAAGAAQARQKVVDFHHLLDGVGRAGLLAVAEGGVGDEKFPGGRYGDELVVKVDPANPAVGVVTGTDVRVWAGSDNIEASRSMGFQTKLNQK